MVSAELLDRIKRSQIDLMRDSLPGLDLQGSCGSGIFGADRRNGLTFVSSYLKPKPLLPAVIVKVNFASCQIGDAECRYDRFVSDVLQSLEFQVHLNLPFCSSSEEYNTDNGRDASDHVL